MLKEKILLIDDEEDILNMLGYNLEKEGYTVYKASNGQDGIDIAKKINPHLIVLDVMMPEMDGMEVCQKIRDEKNLDQTLIAFLTARGEDYSQVAGFDAGADDYITKPIKPKVFLSRIKALLRRKSSYNTSSDEQLKELPIRIDRDQYAVIKNDETIHLPKKEFELLSLLLSKTGKVFTRDVIMNEVWGIDSFVGDRTIDVHIRKLREKIGNDHIKTVKGVGYKFEIE